MKTLKIALSVLMALCVCALVAGCMNNDTAAPQATNGNFAPETTAAITQPPVAFDWVTGSGTIEGMSTAFPRCRIAESWLRERRRWWA